MSNNPRMKFLTLCIGAALAQMALPAMADSGVGVDTVIGNTTNPGGYSTVPAQRDPEASPPKRTPSGQLYSYPPVYSDAAVTGGVEFGYVRDFGDCQATAASGLTAATGQCNDNTRYSKRNEYSDPQNNGLYVNGFDISGQSAGAHYFTIDGAAVGRKDQFYELSTGQYGSWKVKAFYNETPHVFSDTFKAMFTNVGTSHLLMDNGTAGGNGAATAAGLIAYVKTLPYTEVALERKKAGVRGDITLGDSLKAYASVAQEKRTGSRPYTFMSFEGVEPIDYTTNDILVGLNYSNGLTSANLKASASLFKNAIHTVYARDPVVAANAAGTLAASDTFVYSLAPDNQAYNVKGEFAQKFPEFFKAKFTAAAAWGTSRQNDAIRAPIDSSLYANSTVITPGSATVTNTTAADWNGTNGTPLTRATSGQRIDTQLINLALSLNPTDDLAVKGSYRHYATKNKSGTYYSYNPLTGQWFNGLFNGVAAFGIQTPSTANATGAGYCQAPPGYTAPASCISANTIAFIGNSPFAPPRDYKQDNFVLGGDYTLGNNNLEAAVERENFSHTYRERDKTWENKVKLGIVNRSLGDVTLRASWEGDTKRGSFYDPIVMTRDIDSLFAVYGIPYSRAALQALITSPGTGGSTPTLAAIQAALTTTNHNSGGWMKPDQADRNQNIINTRVNYAVREDLDIGGNVQLKRVSYPTNFNFGPQRDNLNSYSFDTNYQPAPGTQISAFFTWQEASQTQNENYGGFAGSGYASLVAYAGAVCGTLSASNIDCWLGNDRIQAAQVQQETHTHSDILGLTLIQDIGKTKFSASYTYNRSQSTIANGYSALAWSQLTALQQGFGTAQPDMTTEQNTLDLSLLIPVTKQLSTRVAYRFDSLRVNDWHYDYASTNTLTTFTQADMGPQNYRVNTFGVFLNYKM